MLRVDLRVEAAAEADRLTQARVLASGTGPFLPDGTLIGFTRRNAVRRQLGRRVLLVWRLADEDAGGRLVESTLVAATIEPSGGWIDARRADWSNAYLLDAIDARCRAWRESVRLTVRQFTSTRVARERAIAAAHIRAATVTFEPGLFDRRADRAQAAHARVAVAFSEEVAARLKRVEAAGALSARSPELLLVLVPRHLLRLES